MNAFPKKLTVCLIFIALPISFLFGCTRKNITPQRTLVVAIESEPANLNPLFALDAYSQRIDQLIYDSLVDIDSDLTIKPRLAESWENPTDTLYRFKLRQGISFHDGSPLTALSVVETFHQILDPNVASPFFESFKNIKNIKVIHPYLLQIQLKKPQASFLTDLTLVKAMPAKKNSPSNNELIGSGPYQFVKKDPNEVVLKKNPAYFKKSNPQMDEIVFKIIKDDHTRLLKLKKGEVDLVQNALSSDSLSRVEQDPRLVVTKGEGLTYSYIGFNLRDPILKNEKVRQAIAHAINRNEIIQHLLQNYATPAKSVLSPLNGYYEDQVQTYEYDPQKAKKLLKDSGVSLPLHLEFKASTQPESINLIRLLSDQLKAIGIDIQIRTHEWGTFFKDIQSGRFQLFSMRWVGVTDPDIYYELFHSKNIPPGRNRCYYSNTRVDKLLERGKITIHPEKRKKIFSEVQKIVAEELPYISLWHLNNVAVYSKRLTNFSLHPQGTFIPFMDISKNSHSH